MPDISSAFGWFLSQAAQQLLWELALGTAAALGLTAAVRRGFGRLQQNKELFWFFGSALVVMLTLFSALTYRPSVKPDLIARVEQATVTSASAASERSMVTFIVSITNAGYMQSIARNFRASADVNGNIHDGTVVGIIDEFAINNSPNSKALVYKEDEALYNRANANCSWRYYLWCSSV
jgi:hypothetical protein